MYCIMTYSVYMIAIVHVYIGYFLMGLFICFTLDITTYSVCLYAIHGDLLCLFVWYVFGLYRLLQFLHYSVRVELIGLTDIVKSLK